jgi:hypothetical protein
MVVVVATKGGSGFEKWIWGRFLHSCGFEDNNPYGVGTSEYREKRIPGNSDRVMCDICDFKVGVILSTAAAR